MVFFQTLAVSLLYFLATSCTGFKLLGDSIGDINKVDDNSILSSITNINQLADYTFTFIPETTLSAGSQVEIVFPDQFTSGLGLGASPSCGSNSCTVSGRTVTITMASQLLTNAATQVIVQQVRNPGSAGGTGNFKIYTKQNGNIVDQNTIFGTIGVSKAVSTLSSASVDVQIGGSYRAGVTTHYDFSFKVNVKLIAGSWIKFTFPNDDYVISSSPHCYSVMVDRVMVQGNLTCTGNGREVSLTGISADIEPGTDVLIRVQVTNPNRVKTTGTFTIDTRRQGTNTIFEKRESIPGVNIIAGLMTKVSLTPVDTSEMLALDKVVYYNLRFTLYNDIPQGGSLSVIFNENINPELAGAPTLYQQQKEFVSGLIDIDFNNQITGVYTAATRTYSITNFRKLSAGSQVQLKFRLTNPGESGDTLPLIIRSFDQSNVTIDENTEDAYVTIASMTGPSQYEIAWNNQVANSSAATLTLTMYPQVEIPSNGVITIEFPTEFTLANPTCKVTPKSNPTQVNANNCSLVGKIITIKITDDVFLPNLDNIVELTGITTPAYPNFYNFKLNTYNSDSAQLESGAFQWEFTPGDFNAAPTVQTIHTEISLPTSITFSVTAKNQIPSGRVPDNLADEYAYIDFAFQLKAGGINQYGTDAWYTTKSVGDSVPCRASGELTPATSNSSVMCNILTLPATPADGDYIVVRVTNFAPIESGESFNLLFPGMKQSSQAAVNRHQVIAYRKVNHEQQIINQNDNVAFATTLVDGSITAVSGGSGATLSQNAINQNSNMTINQAITNITGVDTTIIIQFLNVSDDMYCVENFPLTCSANSESATCTCYQDAKIIVATISSLTASTPLILYIDGLKNPGSVNNNTEQFRIVVVSGAASPQAINTLSTDKNLPTLQNGSISTVDIQESKTYLNVSDVDYSIIFDTQNRIPDNGIIQINFPNEYDFAVSNPQPTCAGVNLKSLNSMGVSCTIQENTITLTNFQGTADEAQLQVIVYGVRTPEFSPSQFEIYTYDSNRNLIDQNFQVSPPELDFEYTPLRIEFAGVYTFPSNEKVRSNIEVSFETQSNIPVKSRIIMTLPASSFGSLGTNVNCRVSGAFLVFDDCLVAGRSAYVTLSQELPSNTSLTLHLDNIFNPEQGLSAPLDLYIEYDSVILDRVNTGDVTQPIFITTTSEAALIDVDPVTFYPQNEGEPATYVFTFTPVVNIEVGQTISVLFPSEFALELGDNLLCWAEGLEGEISCRVTNSRTLDIRDFERFIACSVCQITIYAQGIINPNYNSGAQTSNFRLGVRSDRHFLQFNESVGRVSFLPAPGLIQVESITPSNLYAREENSFTFKFTTTNTLRRSSQLGAIWVNFPEAYELINFEPYCKSSWFWASGLPSCSVDARNLVFTGQSTDYSGQLELVADYIPNPITDGPTDSIIIKTYDGLNRKVLDSSYPNLAPNNFEYTYGGPLITIGNDQTQVIRAGVMSEPIPIQLIYPAALNMTITPDSDTLSVDPFNIEFHVGDLLQYFRISAPDSTPANTFYITWTVTGDTEPKYYAPVLNTRVEVETSGIYPVHFGTFSEVAVGGRSLPIRVYVDNSPDVTVIVNVDLFYPYGGIELSAYSLEFIAGETEKFITVSAASTVDVNTDFEARLNFSLSGSNRNAYKLDLDSVILDLSTFDYPEPKVNSVVIGSITKNSAQVNVVTNQIGTVYYAVALKGTQMPTFEEVKSQSIPDYPSTQTMYGRQYAYSNELSFQINGLRAEQYYTVYVYLENLIGQNSKVAFFEGIETASRYPAASFSLRFFTNYINREDEQNITTALKLIFALPDWRLIIKNDDPNRHLQIQEVTVMEFYVIDDLDSSNYPTPRDIVFRLETNRSVFASRIPYWDSEQPIEIVDEYLFDCFFDELPVIDPKSYYNSISSLAALSQPGYIFAIVQEAQFDSRNATAWQIYQGINGQNQPAANRYAFVEGGILSNITFTNLKENTEYNAYFACGNAYPGEVQLKEDDNVYSINWRTASRPSPMALDLDNATTLTYFLGLLMLII